MKIINLTTYDVILYANTGQPIRVPPSGSVAKVEYSRGEGPQLDVAGMPIRTQIRTSGTVKCNEDDWLPDTEEGVLFFVDAEVFSHLNGRRHDIVTGGRREQSGSALGPTSRYIVTHLEMYAPRIVNQPILKPASDPSWERRKQLKAKVIERTRGLLDDARRLLRVEIPDIDISFSLEGTPAGTAAPTHINFNMKLLEENEKDFLLTTVPHEVSHVVVAWKYPDVGRSRETGRKIIKDHGTAWKEIMRFFRAPALRTHIYDCSKGPSGDESN